MPVIPVLAIALIAIGCANKNNESLQKEQVGLMTLNPGHFHAALVQKNPIEVLGETVHIYAPEGPDLDLHMSRIEGFNNRSENPTNWESRIYTGPDYVERMLEERPGNVMVTAGNNRLKTSYIQRAVSNGINVLSDKPMAIDTGGWQLLREAFSQAEQNNVLLYDIMTERREVTSGVLRRLMQEKELFGELAAGTVEEPAIFKESIHHLFKYVAGSPLKRPPWYFDVSQQGEGIVDVTVHLVDLSMWVAFPEQIVRHTEDVTLLDARRWPTTVTRGQFERITGEPEFPEYLADQLDEQGSLPLYSNGEIDYMLNGHHVRVRVQWDYQAPEGGNDSHFTIIRGTRSNLVVRQGKEQNYKATVYVEPANGVTRQDLEPALASVIQRLQQQYPGAGFADSPYGLELQIPDEFHFGHEAHFGMVAQSFFEYLSRGALPEWEVPNMITKYYITTHAREMALRNSEK
ncbi:MAG: oxidoreductase [Balneolaceae bacterium]|nr:MAG: oxidoreductase [Balneolaceae bacterium]